MTKRAAHLALLMAAAATLSGCQIMGVHRLSSAADTVKAVTAPSSLQEGRQALAENRTGAAIDAFNLALFNGEDPAAAYNGLGVAYARLGRDDLAYRLFRKAVMSDPANPVYSRNFALLMDSPRFTLRTMAEAEPQPSIAQPPQPEAKLAADERGAKLVRSSGHQFSLVTAEPAAVDAPAATRTAALSCRSARRTATCPSARLPLVGSRKQAEGGSKANRSKDPAQAAAWAELMASFDTAPAETGKRKVYDLSTMPRTQSQQGSGSQERRDGNGRS